MSRKLALVTLVTLLALLATGCGSLYNLGVWGSQPHPRVYGGVVFDVNGIADYNEDFLVPLYLIILDLPFSFVLDTALFPVLLVLHLCS